jgi:hypothetical protein
MTQSLATQDPDCPLVKEGLKLNEYQTRYVYAYVQNGGHGGNAAREAGYAPSGADGMSSRNLANPSIIRGIYVLTALRLGSHLPGALATMAKLSTGAKSEYVRQVAAKDILDRVGMAAPKRVEVNGSVSVSIDLG